MKCIQLTKAVDTFGAAAASCWAAAYTFAGAAAASCWAASLAFEVAVGSLLER